VLRDGLSVRRVRTPHYPSTGASVMAKKRRRVAADAATHSEETGPSRSLPTWKWRTFPVLFAFAAGALLMAVINGEPNNTAAAAAQIIALLGVSYGAARIFVRNVIWKRRMRARGEGPERREPQRQEDDEYEDVVIYPEKQGRRRV